MMLVDVDGSMQRYDEAHRSFDGIYSWKLQFMEVVEVWKPWKLPLPQTVELEVCDTRASRWKCVGVYGRTSKLPHNILVEAAIDRSNRSFHFHRQWKLHVLA